MSDGVDDTEVRDFLVVDGQTAGIAEYMNWKDKSWPDRQGGTRSKDFLDGYSAALRRVVKVTDTSWEDVENAIRDGRL